MPTVLIGAEPWYSSGTFWAQMGVGVALLIGVPTFLATWVPRQRLYYWAPPATPLLAPGTRGIADLEIRHDGRQLADPHLVAVTLTVRGRRDIPSSAFDQGRPLVFDLGAGIVKVLQVRCSPAASLVPPVTIDGSALRVGPELVGRHQITTISVLVDGARPHLVCTQPVLAQVTLIPRDPPDGLSWSKVLAVAVVAAAPAGLGLGLASVTVDGRPVGAAVAAVAGAAVVGVMVVGAVAAVQWLRRRASSG
jgi:hypothetical protein